MDISFLTFNVGLLDINLFGISFFKPAAFIEQRLKDIPFQVTKTNVDLIAFQEVYLPRHQYYLVSNLKNKYPYYASPKTPGLKWGSGLMIFSKYPIRKWNFYKFSEKGLLDEVIFITRGFIGAEIVFNQAVTFTIYNCHLTSGGSFNRLNNQKVNIIRNRQIDEIIQNTSISESQYTVILGDFNSGTTISKINYENILEHGYIDIYKEYCRNIGKKEKNTWDIKNPLINTTGHNKSSRLDHIFSHQDNRIEILNAKIVFDDNIVLIDKNKDATIPLSDHYGLQATISII